MSNFFYFGEIFTDTGRISKQQESLLRQYIWEQPIELTDGIESSYNINLNKFNFSAEFLIDGHQVLVNKFLVNEKLKVTIPENFEEEFNKFRLAELLLGKHYDRVLDIFKNVY